MNDQPTITIPTDLFLIMAGIVAEAPNCCDHSGEHCEGLTDPDNAIHREAAEIWPTVEALMNEHGLEFPEVTT